MIILIAGDWHSELHETLVEKSLKSLGHEVISFKWHIYFQGWNRYFDIYQKFFIEKIKGRKIETIYTVKPLYGDDDVLKDVLDDNCVSKIIVNDILEKHLIKKCNQML